MKTRQWWIFGVVVLGCAAPDLRPGPLAHRLDEDTAAATDHGVHVVAEADAWTGPTRIGRAVTPLKLSIENKSQRPIRVQLSKLKLLDGADHYTALPPLKISGAVPAAEAPRGWVGTEPGFPAIGFGMAPSYSTVYSEYGVFERNPFPYDAPYYGTYRDWPAEQLPTPAMIGRALPEGVLEPGGHVEGFVYFKRLPRDVDSVSFLAQFEDADEETNTLVASVKIPFTYEP